MYKSVRQQLHTIKSPLLGRALGALEGSSRNAMETIHGLTGRFAIIDVFSTNPAGYKFLSWGCDMLRKPELSVYVGRPFGFIIDDCKYRDNITRDWQDAIYEGVPTCHRVATSINHRYYEYDRVCFPILRSYKMKKATELIILSEIRAFAPFHRA